MAVSQCAAAEELVGVAGDVMPHGFVLDAHPADGDGEDLAELGDVGALGEVVVAVALQHVEDLAVHVEGGTDGEAGVGGEEGDALLGDAEVAARAGDLEAHERAVPVVQHAVLEVFLCVAEPSHVLERQVDAPAQAVLAHVAQDVGELQRDAQRQRGVGGGAQPPPAWLVGADDGQGHQPHRARHAVAVEI